MIRSRNLFRIVLIFTICSTLVLCSDSENKVDENDDIDGRIWNKIYYGPIKGYKPSKRRLQEIENAPVSPIDDLIGNPVFPIIPPAELAAAHKASKLTAFNGVLAAARIPTIKTDKPLKELDSNHLLTLDERIGNFLLGIDENGRFLKNENENAVPQSVES